MGAVATSSYTCLNTKPDGLNSVVAVSRTLLEYEEVADKLGTQVCKPKIAKFALKIMDSIESMCQSGFQDKEILRKTSSMINEMTDHSAKCIASEMVKNYQQQKDTADKMKKTLKESAPNFSPITPEAYSLISVEISQQKTSAPSQKEPETFHFPPQNALETCLKQHPQTSNHYLSEKNIVQEAAKGFADSEKYKAGIQLGAALLMADKQEQLKLSDITTSIIGTNLTNALEDCTIESEKSKK